jgi:Ca-activated chloride channel family protein
MIPLYRGMGWGFEYPRSLALLWFLLPVFFLMILHYRKYRVVFRFFSPARDAAFLRTCRIRYWASALSFLLFLALLFIALAGPHWGFRQVPEFHRGVDVVIAVDLSRSMEAADGAAGSQSPETGISRLDRAAAIARELALKPGIRFGAAVGKGMGILALPLTEDSEAILAFLEGFSPGLITGRGTNLESLITAASGAFKDTYSTRRWIVLFSDGEGLSGSLSAAAEAALARDIAVITVGLGAETGSPVPLGPGTLLAEDGLPVISYRRDEALRNTAEHTGGIYLEGGREDAAELIAGHILSRSSEFAAAGFRREPAGRGYLFVLLALGAFGLSRLLEKGRRRAG